MKNEKKLLQISQVLYILPLVLLLFLVSCKDEFSQEAKTGSAEKQMSRSGNKLTFSGDSILLKNPYTVQNMTIALERLKSAQSSKYFNDFNIKPSHLYLKFIPKNAEEEALLKLDSTIHYFDYRLDAEYREGFLENRTSDKDSIPDYYAAIAVDHKLPDVHYEVISELYIPEQDPYFSDIKDYRDYEVTGTINNKTDLFNNLLYQAFEQTGNTEELLSENPPSTSGKWIFGSKWYPSGTIRVNDDILGVVPVTGAQVLMRQWFTVAQGITDGNGNFSTSSVRGKAKYVIQWERYNYSIRNGSIFQAEMKGPNVKNQSWSPVIDGGEDEYHALIHQAAHDYYYGYRFGLHSPPENNHFYSFGHQHQVKIAARKTAPWGVPSSYSHIRSEITFGLSAQVHIKAYGKKSDRIYGTTIHELSHALHSVIDRGSYNDICLDAFLSNDSAVRNRNRRLLETWPTTVEILMTLHRYQSIRAYAVYFDNGSNNYQNRTIAAENHYTSGGYDMIDHLGQSGLYGIGYPVDRVSDYTAPQLEQALIGARNWTQWRDKIKNNYNNPTKIYLDELFNNWQD
jgi:hypothetical protein